MGDNLKKNMIGALTWSSVSVGGMQFIQLIIGIILARILVPDDFGLIGVLYIFIGLSTVLIDGGFGQGLIRKKDADNKDFSTIFFLNILIGVLLYGLLYVMAPSIASFFSQPKLIILSRVIFISVLIYPLYQIQLIQLLKKLDYKSIAIVNIISIGLSGSLAAVLAFNGVGVWSLVYQQLAFHVIRTLTFPFFLRWKPIFSFSFSTIHQLWRFTVPMLGQGLLNVVFTHIYTIIIGRFYPLNQVGYFTQANKYSETVNVASNSILNTATFPLLAKIQEDRERSLRVYRKLISSVSMLTFPLAIVLIIAAEPIIITLISEKWMASVVLFQLLLAANLFTPMFTINISILNASGASRNSLRLELIKKSLITLSIVGSFSFGIKAMLLSFIAANYIAYLISMYFIKQSLHHHYRNQIKDLLSKLLIVLVTGAIVASIGKLSLTYLQQMMVQLGAFAIIYLLLIKIFLPTPMKEFFQLFSSKNKRKEP